MKGAAKAASKKKNALQVAKIEVTEENANKVTKETNASAGPEDTKEVTKEIKASENKVMKEPQGLVEKDSPQEPPPPLDRLYLVKRRALFTQKSFMSSLVPQVIFLFKTG